MPALGRAAHVSPGPLHAGSAAAGLGVQRGLHHARDGASARPRLKCIVNPACYTAGPGTPSAARRTHAGASAWQQSVPLRTSTLTAQARSSSAGLHPCSSSPCDLRWRSWATRRTRCCSGEHLRSACGVAAAMPCSALLLWSFGALVCHHSLRSFEPVHDAPRCALVSRSSVRSLCIRAARMFSRECRLLRGRGASQHARSRAPRAVRERASSC
jgi:hypothetical protein